MYDCKNHPRTDAVWQCNGCRGSFCDSCIVIKTFGPSKVETCKKCGDMCRPIPGSQLKEIKPQAATLSSAFAYPFQSNSWITLMAGVVVIAVLNWMQSLFVLIGWALMLGYGMKIIKTTAAGELDAPDWDTYSSFGELLRPLALGLVTAVVAFTPAIWAFDHWGKGAPFLGFLLLGALYAPMAWIAAAISNRFIAVTPLGVVPLLFRVDSSYWVACGVLMISVLVSSFGLAYLGMATHGIVGVLLTTFVSLYFLMAEMRILGLVYYRNRLVFGYE